MSNSKPVESESSNTENNETCGSAGPEGKYFQGTRFIYAHPDCAELWQVTYEKEVLLGLTSAIQDISVQHGFSVSKPRELLCSVLGVGNDVVSIPGPSFVNRKTYPVTYNFLRDFLSRDRNFVRSLLEAIYCNSSFSAHGVKVVSLEEIAVSVEFDHSVGKRKIELYYKTGLHNDDRMSVIIEGYGKKPNTFCFRHTMYWVSKRLVSTVKRSRPARIEADVD